MGLRQQNKRAWALVWHQTTLIWISASPSTSCMTLTMSFKCFDTQFSSVAQSCLTLCDTMDCSTPGFPCPSPTPGAYSNSCPSHWWSHPTISSSVVPFSSHLQSFPASGSFRFSFSISPFSECSGLISFRMDWMDLLVVQGTLKSLLQHHI